MAPDVAVVLPVAPPVCVVDDAGLLMTMVVAGFPPSCARLTCSENEAG